MTSPVPQPDYDAFLAAVKDRVRITRQRAIAAANEELLRCYWEIGHPRELSKTPCPFEWLGLDEQAGEAEVERGLVAQVERFLLELGEGFALVGRQHRLEVSGNEYRIDLLLYQLRLRCYVVIELKVGPFKPEYVGKLGFYLAAVDDLVAGEHDNPTIGLVLCKGADETIAEYALRDSTAPIQISEYRTQPLPEPYRDALPSVERLVEHLRQLPMPEA